MSTNYYTARVSVGQQMTVAAWIRNDHSYTMTAMGFRKQGGGPFDYCFQVNINTAPPGDLSVVIVSISGGWSVTHTSSDMLPKDQFVHVAVSRASNFESKLFVNGILKTTGSSLHPLPACDTLYLGGSSDSLRGFHGYMQDVRVYNRVLSQSEVQTLAAVHPKCEVACSVSGLVNAAMPSAATSLVRLSTFGEEGMPLQTQNGIEFPAVSSVAGTGGALSLSNYVAASTRVVVTVSFIAPSALNSNAIKLISISGLRFSGFNTTAAAPSCSNISPSPATVTAAFTASSGVLLLNLSHAAAPASTPAAIVCTVEGFTNAATPGAASASVRMSSFFENETPLQTQSNIMFPEIVLPRVVSGVSPALHPSTSQTNVSVYGSSAGLSDWSGRVRVGITACHSTQWRQDTLVLCRISSGVGFNLPVTSSVLLNQGKLSFGSVAATIGMDGLEVVGSCNASLSGGDGFIQIGNWRFGRVDDNHFSFSSNNGRTAVILRSDGTVYGGNGQRTDWGLSHLPITWTYSASNPMALESLPNVQFGTSWVQFGPNCRIGTPDNVHLSVSFKNDGSAGIHTAGNIFQLYHLLSACFMPIKPLVCRYLAPRWIRFLWSPLMLRPWPSEYFPARDVIRQRVVR